MLKIRKNVFLSIGVFALTASGIQSGQLCTGFVPKNDLYIPAYMKDQPAPGISLEEFEDVLSRVEEVYAPIVKSKGGTLDMRRLWENGTVNASAERIGSTYRVNMYGGMARHKLMTADAFMLIACHEMGHHVGGMPKYSGFLGMGNSWASTEGQSDYFGTAKCMRKVYLNMTDDELFDFEDNNEYAKTRCAEVFGNSRDQAFCVRNTLAGIVLGNVLSSLNNGGEVKLETPSTEIANGVFQRHPKAQCRLDTYFQGSLCPVAHNEDFSDSNQVDGTCSTQNGFNVGLRPKCWFNPSQKISVNAQQEVEILEQDNSGIFY